jgi:hypothetical protein
MISKIRLIEPYYSKLEYTLPEEIMHRDITEKLEKAKNEMKKIMEEDLKNIQVLARNEKKVIAFNKFSKPYSIIKMALYIFYNQNGIVYRGRSLARLDRISLCPLDYESIKPTVPCTGDD